MTEREAIEVLEEALRYNTMSNEKVWEAFHVAEEALEKQIPKKPIITRNKNSKIYTCPNCKRDLIGALYCEKCGQKIDWSEEE